jgi:hypothetical protein
MTPNRSSASLSTHGIIDCMRRFQSKITFPFSAFMGVLADGHYVQVEKYPPLSPPPSPVSKFTDLLIVVFGHCVIVCFPAFIFGGKSLRRALNSKAYPKKRSRLIDPLNERKPIESGQTSTKE